MTYDTQIDLGLSTGFGIEALIKDKFAIGIEYRKTSNKFKVNNNDIKVKTDNAMINLDIISCRKHFK